METIKIYRRYSSVTNNNSLTVNGEQKTHAGDLVVVYVPSGFVDIKKCRYFNQLEDLVLFEQTVITACKTSK